MTTYALGWQHQQTRAAMPRPHGQECPFCRRPMWADQDLDLDHAVPRALGGRGGERWSHSSCNRRAGAVLGNLLRGHAAGNDDWLDRWA